MEQKKYVDIAIAGGSLAGVLTAIRLKSTHPQLKIALLEKDDHLGGRQTCLTWGANRQPTAFGYGLNLISEPLHRYWLQCLQDIKEPTSQEYGKDLLTLFEKGQALNRLGIFSGGKMAESALKDLLTEKTAKAFGGPAAQREWTSVTDILQKFSQITDEGTTSPDGPEDSQDSGAVSEKSSKNQSLGHYWNHPRKSPAAIVLEQIATSLGIPDLWNASPLALIGRSQQFTAAPFGGSISQWLHRSIEWAGLEESVEVSNMILNVRYENKHWELKCQKDTIVTPHLVVAQSPWNALNWLSKSFWPTPVLHVALKTKPVSIVVLCERLEVRPESLPDIILIPAEKAQALVLPTSSDTWEISFQATIDYELSIQAPAVIKAVKALKRSRKKLQVLYPGSISEFNHIALQPDAWASSPMAVDYKWIQSLASKSISSSHLSFVGDAYGPSHHGDANIIRSINQCLNKIS
jgi:hypothetical protein